MRMLGIPTKLPDDATRDETRHTMQDTMSDEIKDSMPDTMQDTMSDETEEDGGGQDVATSASPRRTILVDGFNVLHAVLLGKEREGWWRRALRERLLERVRAWDGGPDEIWVAFDGSRPAESVWAEPVASSSALDAGRDPSGPIVHQVFVESADDWIVRRARRTQRPERLLVVSADRKVAGRARSAGCEVLTPWAFIARCPCGSPDPDVPASTAGLESVDP